MTTTYLCEWCQELQVQGLSLEKVNTVTSAEMEHLACLSKFQQLWLPQRDNDEFQQIWIPKEEYHESRQLEVISGDEHAVRQLKEYDD